MKNIDFPELRVQLDRKVKDKQTTIDQLVAMWDFFMEHVYVVDNEIKPSRKYL